MAAEPSGAGQRRLCAQEDSSIHVYGSLPEADGRLAVVEEVSLPELPQQISGADHDSNRDDDVPHSRFSFTNATWQYVCSEIRTGVLRCQEVLGHNL